MAKRSNNFVQDPKNKKFKQEESSITDAEEERRSHLPGRGEGMQQTAGNITNIINNNNINNFIIGDPTKVPPVALLGGKGVQNAFIEGLQKQQRI